MVASGVRLILNWVDCADVKRRSCCNGNNAAYPCGFCSSFPALVALQPRVAQKLTLLVSSCPHFAPVDPAYLDFKCERSGQIAGRELWK